MKSTMDVEIKNFIKIWIIGMASQGYTCYISSRIPSGIPRLVSLLPIIYLFITLPLTLSSFHLAAPTVFYLVWLANFKLLLFSFNQGPLSSQDPPLSLPHFIAMALLPIKSKSDDDPHQNSLKKRTPSQLTPEILRKRRQFKIIRFLIKLTVFVIVIGLYRYRQRLHPNFIMVLYCCHMYLGVEFLLAITAIPVRSILGLELARQFNEPYLATSLQDFWGRRWNLMVTNILRQSVYNPIRSIFRPILGGNWSRAIATLATFSVSGLMHEVLFYYLSRASPTWEVTWFFVLHGVCVTCEIYVKRAVAGRWRLSRAASRMLTVVFVGVSGDWLFFPQLIRYGLDLKAIEEYYMFVRFARDKLRLLGLVYS